MNAALTEKTIRLICLYASGIALAVIFLVSSVEAFNVFHLTAEALETDSPFGTEQGFNYTSKEIYFYVLLANAALALQGLVFSYALNAANKNSLAIASLLFALGLIYGLDYLGYVFYTQAG